VILEPQAVADVLPFLTDSFDARTADEGRSAFSKPEGRTKVGEPLFDSRINLFSDPAHAELPAPPATEEGVPATRMSIVHAGVLENLVYSRFWARTKERAPSPGPVNFILEGAGQAESVADMIKATDRGLLITRFWYVRLVDPRTVMITGLTRDGVWLIENGRVLRPVGNLRCNQSLLAMLAPGNVEMVGIPERRYPMMVPALKLKSFAFTSQSDAV
jgi:predicted Zn-dependent protease